MDVLLDVDLVPTLTNKRTLDIPGGGEFNNDSDIRFDRCIRNGIPAVNDHGYDNYALMVHEAGHAPGPSEFSYKKPTSWQVAHPMVLESVMNYDDETEVPEPDCSPHPLDIMAIYGLYQKLRP